MPKKNSNKKIPFKKFLDKSTGLITIFGIFNALFIYSNSMENGGAKEFLVLAFYVLSLLVWIEIFLFTLRSSDKNWRYKVFYLSASMVLTGLTWYFISTFYPVLLGVGIGLILQVFVYIFLILLFFVPFILISKLIDKFINKLSPKLAQKISIDNISIGKILTGIIIGAFIIGYSRPVLKYSFEKMKLEEYINNKLKSESDSVRTDSIKTLNIKMDSTKIDRND